MKPRSRVPRERPGLCVMWPWARATEPCLAPMEDMVGATSGSGEAFRLASGLDLEAGGRPGNAFGGSGRALSPTPGRRCRLLGLCQSWVAGVLGPIKHKRRDPPAAERRPGDAAGLGCGRAVDLGAGPFFCACWGLFSTVVFVRISDFSSGPARGGNTATSDARAPCPPERRAIRRLRARMALSPLGGELKGGVGWTPEQLRRAAENFQYSLRVEGG